MTKALPIGLQLYTLREALAQDFAGTLRRVAEIGYTGVETAFFDESIATDAANVKLGRMSLIEVRQQLCGLGLTVFCAHTSLPLGENRDAVLRHADALGCQRIVWHGWSQDARYSTLDGVRQLADEYNAANEIARAHGLHLGLHNHWWEMTPLASGQLPYRLLLQQLDSRIFFELDTYWATVAGQDAIAVIHELGPRAPLLHIKDGPAVHGQPMTAVGSGTLDISAIVTASHGTADWLIVELDDCATDMTEAVAQSFTYLKELYAHESSASI